MLETLTIFAIILYVGWVCEKDNDHEKPNKAH